MSTTKKSLTILAILLISLTPIAFAASTESEDESFTLSDLLVPLGLSKKSTRSFSTLSSQTPTTISDHNMIKDLSSNILNQYTPSGTYVTDLFTGSAAYSYPIAAPPGINGLEPGISLSYNHHQTALKGVLGNSWSLTKNYIYRDIKGTLSDLSDDKFKLHFNGVDMEIVYSSSDNKYHTQIENFWKIDKKTGANNQNGEYWTVTTKDGTIYRFGYHHNSEFLSNQGQLFTNPEEFVSIWSLDLITDTHSNNIVFEYNENLGEDNYPYLSKIFYNDEINLINFSYDNNTFNGFNGYQYGTKISQNALLEDIQIISNDSLVRRYHLEYQTINHKRFLNKVRYFGADNIGELPSTQFTYNAPTKGWTTNSNYRLPSEAYLGESKDNGARLMDINGDGFDDTIRMYNSNNMDYWLNNKNNGWGGKATYTSLLEGGIVNDWGQDLGVRFFDVNADTRVDILKLLKDTATVKKILINTGNGFEEQESIIAEEISFIEKLEASETCTPPSCPYEYADGGVSCNSGSCTRTCSIQKCSGTASVVMDDYSNDNPDWNDDDYDEEDSGNGFTPSTNKCYKFEFTGSEDTASDDSECYDLYTYDDYNPGVYDDDCNGRDIDAYAGIGFTGNEDSSTWLQTVPGDPNGEDYGYLGDNDNSYWSYRYLSEYDKDSSPDESGSNAGDWTGFNHEICDEAGTHTIFCAPTWTACQLWGQYRCGYDCANEKTYPYVVMGVYADYNNDLGDALDDNWDCDTTIADNDYDAYNNHYKVTEYSLTTNYNNQQCDYAVNEYRDTGTRLADINGDGKTDIIRATESVKKIWLNKGDGFLKTFDWEIPNDVVFVDTNTKKDGGTRIVDVNGDGLPDLIKGKDSVRITWINNGKTWVQNDDWVIPSDAVFISSDQDKGIVFIDVDGDGMTDILRADSGTKKVWINTGKGWTYDSSWSIPSSINFVGPSSTIADFNGDGLPDLTMAKSSSNKESWTNRAEKGYLLTSIKEMFGGITTLAYEKITSIDNTGEDSINDLPFTGYVVSSITKNNGLSGGHQITSTISYSYSSGLYNSTDKEFRGFKEVIETLPDNSRVLHSFNQDRSRKGLEYETTILDSSSKQLKKTEYWYRSQAKLGPYYIVQLNEVTDYTYE